jgi:glycosyltransferase involved in cell wall biosynthesis
LPWLQQAKTDNYLLVTADKDQSNYCQRINALLAENQLQDRVIWLGAQKQMADLYAYVDITVSVNRKPESFGRTVLESLSVGTPVIGLNHGGVAEILVKLFPQGIVERKQPQLLITKLNQFLETAPAVNEQQLFSNTKQFEQTLAVYEQLMHEKSC